MKKSFIFKDMEIKNPFRSECGRFTVDPLKYYKLTIDELDTLWQANAQILIQDGYYEREILRMMAKYEGLAGAESIFNDFDKSNQLLEDFVLTLDGAEQWTTGGGCMVSVLPLKNTKTLFCVTEEVALIYKDADHFWDGDGELRCWYIKIVE